jgi:hypothetical protein
MPWLKDCDRASVRVWCQLEFLGEQIFLELMTGGVFTPEREVRRLVTDLRQLRQTQLSYSFALGMTPSSRANMPNEMTGKPLLDLEAFRAAPDTPNEDQPE